MDLKKIYVALTDVWHAALGLITAQTTKHYQYLGSMVFLHPLQGLTIPIFIAVLFIVYQSLDNDSEDERVGDLVEYIIGLIVGLAI